MRSWHPRGIPWCVLFILGALTGLSAAAQPTAFSAVEQVAVDLCGKKTVLLGELPSHGEARAFQAKAEIAEHLIRHCGFDVILFEAPVYDFLGFQEAVAERRATPAQLDKAIGGFWLSRELAAWREWLYSRAVQEQLYMGGLDDQISATSDYARTSLPALVAGAIPGRRGEECREAVERNLFWHYDQDSPFDEAEKLLLERCGRLAADSIAAQSGRSENARLMADNLATLYARQRAPAEARDRDQAMYHNVLSHAARVPPDSRFIIWTATVHAARKQGEREQRPLGTWLAEWQPVGLAAVGFSAYAGESSMAGMPKRVLSEAPQGSLEALATSSDTGWVHLNKTRLNELGVRPSRLLGRFTSANWSLFFDAVLVVREEVAPSFEPR